MLCDQSGKKKNVKTVHVAKIRYWQALEQIALEHKTKLSNPYNSNNLTFSVTGQTNKQKKTKKFKLLKSVM